MPKFGIHIHVLDEVAAKLSAANGNTPIDQDKNTIGNLLNNNRFEAALGAIGPDLLFWAPDYNVIEQLKTLINIYTELKSVKDDVDEAIEKIEEGIDDTVDEIVNELIQIPIIGPAVQGVKDFKTFFEKLTDGFETIFNNLDNDIEQALMVRVLGLDGSDEGATMARSLFQGLFQSSSQMGREEMDWYWFEMLHYRNTGDFLKNLIENAENMNSDSAKAYAYAYATHVAADLTGHPYVNTVSGAPYRIAVQRHVVIENYMDQWKWMDAYGTNIRETLFAATDFKSNKDMPDEVAELLEKTLKNTYEDLIHPLRFGNPLDGSGNLKDFNDYGFLTKDDIKLAYRAQKIMLEFLGNMEPYEQPTEPFDGADELVATWFSEMDELFSQETWVVQPENGNSDNLLLNLDEFFAAIQDTISNLIDIAKQMLDSLRDMAAGFAGSITTLTDIPKQLTLTVFYAIEKLIYHVYKEIHQILSLSGLTYPEPEDVDLGERRARTLITTTSAANRKLYPTLKNPGQPHLDDRTYVDGTIDPFRRYTSTPTPSAILRDEDLANASNDARRNPYFLTTQNELDLNFLANPENSHEKPHTESSFYPKNDSTTPDIFIANTPLDEKLLLAYANCSTPAETAKLYADFKGKSFGNAVDLSVYILANRKSTNSDVLKAVYCNWNLDGDRGYGYKSWDGIPPTALKGEVISAMQNLTERRTELVKQRFKTWSTVQTTTSNESDYQPEIYIDNKSFADSLITAMNISEANIPSSFFNFSTTTSTDEWIKLLPKRLEPNGSTFNENFYFINGMATPANSGIRVAMSIQHILNEGFKNTNARENTSLPENLRVKLLLNYTAQELGDLNNIADVGQSVLKDLLNSIAINTAIDKGSRIKYDEMNPTTVGVLALLHFGMKNDKPLIISSHSQGCIITANAIMCFAETDTANKDYLQKKVKVLHFEPEILNSYRAKIRANVNQYLVYIMNVSDPNGTDILTEMAGGDALLVPQQIGSFKFNDTAALNVLSVLENPEFLNLQYYRDVFITLRNAGNDYLGMVNFWHEKFVTPLASLDLKAHYIPTQFDVMEADIRLNRFRVDPGVLAANRRAQQLSVTNGATGGLNVRNFFLP